MFETGFYRDFPGLSGTQRSPDRVSILRFRHLLENHELSPKILQVVNAKLATCGLRLKTGTVVDTTLIAPPSSTKNKTGERDPEMHQAKKANQWRFGMKAHIGVNAESGLVHTVIAAAANACDVTQGHGLLHGQENMVFADAAYQNASIRAKDGASVSGDQAPVWPGLGALSRAQEKHGAVDHAVCAIQYLEGQR